MSAPSYAGERPVPMMTWRLESPSTKSTFLVSFDDSKVAAEGVAFIGFFRMDGSLRSTSSAILASSAVVSISAATTASASLAPSSSQASAASGSPRTVIIP